MKVYVVIWMYSTSSSSKDKNLNIERIFDSKEKAENWVRNQHVGKYESHKICEYPLL